MGINMPPSKTDASSAQVSNVLENIREAIIRGTLSPGDHLKENLLARSFNASRFHVREALRSLQGEGLVASIPYKGNFVRVFSTRDARELFTVRCTLEELGLRLMFPRLSAKILRDFRKAFDRMAAAAEKGDMVASTRADLKFHRMFCFHADNARLLGMWDNLVHHVELFLFMERSGFLSGAGYVKTHVDLLDAIEQRNLGLAEAHLRIHLDSGLKNLLDALG